MTIVIKAPAKSRGQMPARILSAQKPRVLLPLAPDGLPPPPPSLVPVQLFWVKINYGKREKGTCPPQGQALRPDEQTDAFLGRLYERFRLRGHKVFGHH